MSPSSSPITSSSPKPAPNKAKQWKLLIINFKSNWGKKEELQLSLIDISFRSEIHLDPSLPGSDFILANYKAFLLEPKGRLKQCYENSQNRCNI